MRQQIHNHPGCSPEPSGKDDRINPKTGKHEKAGTWGDISAKKTTINRYGPGVTFYIYIPCTEKYYDY